MTRTAISPRLATRTFENMRRGRLSVKCAVATALRRQRRASGRWRSRRVAQPSSTSTTCARPVTSREPSRAVRRPATPSQRRGHAQRTSSASARAATAPRDVARSGSRADDRLRADADPDHSSGSAACRLIVAGDRSARRRREGDDVRQPSSGAATRRAAEAPAVAHPQPRRAADDEEVRDVDERRLEPPPTAERRAGDAPPNSHGPHLPAAGVGASQPSAPPRART